MRPADHSIITVHACGDGAVMVAVEVITIFVKGVSVPPLEMAILKEDVVIPTGMVVALFATGSRGIGEHRMGCPPEITIGLEPTFRAPMAKRVPKITPHPSHKLVKLRRSNGRLELLATWHAEPSIASEPRVGHKDRSAVGKEPVCRDERGRIEPSPGERAAIGRRREHPMIVAVPVEGRGNTLQVPLDTAGPRVGNRVVDQWEDKDRGGQRGSRKEDLVKTRPARWRGIPDRSHRSSKRHRLDLARRMGMDKCDCPCRQTDRRRQRLTIMAERVRSPPQGVEISPEALAFSGVSQRGLDVPSFGVIKRIE